MNTNEIVLAIDAEIAQLQKVKSLLTDTDISTKRNPGRPTDVGMPNKVTNLNPVQSAKKPVERRGSRKDSRGTKGTLGKFRKATNNAARRAASS